MKVFVADPNAKKLPFWPMVSVVCLSFLDLFCVNVSIPNIPFMCQMFFPDIPQTETGFYSGYLVGIYSVGGVIGNLLWGWFADQFGRKPCLLISTLGTCICFSWFGLSRSYAEAMAARFIWGLLNSTLGIVKTYVSEICSSHTMATGFSLISTAQGVARIVGPLVGGSFANPQYYFPEFVKTFPIFGEFPFFLPHFIGSIFCLFVFIITIICAPESLCRKDIIKAEEMKQHNKKKVQTIKEKMSKDPNYVPTVYETHLIAITKDTYWDMIKQKDVVLTCLFYGLTSLIQGTQDALLPLWLLNPISKGGFLWDQNDIGWLYCGLGPVQVVFAPVIFPILTKIITYKTHFIYSGYIYGISLALHPLASLSNTSYEWLQWFSILCIVTFAICIRQCNFTSVMVLITNSTYMDFRGKVNGLGQVFASIGRAIGPSIGSTIFAWSCSQDRPFPLNFGLAFYLIGIFMCLFSCIGHILPSTINTTKPYLYKVLQEEEKGMEMNDVEAVQVVTPEGIVEQQEKEPNK